MRRYLRFFPLVLIIIFLIFTITVIRDKNGGKMARDEMYNKLGALDLDQPEGLDTLAQGIAEQSHIEPRYVVEYWVNGPDEVSWKAGAVASRLESLTIMPLLEMPVPLNADRRSMVITNIADAQIGLREQIVNYLVKLLDDQELLSDHKSPEGRPTEGSPPDMRVCDEAYLQLRRLLNFSESEEEFEENASIYLDLDFEDRDEEIADVRASGKWDRWMNESVEMDEE